jgi:hypothetical protein
VSAVRRGAVAALALVLGAGLLAGCGDPDQAYCQALQKHQRVFADDGSGDELLVGLPTLRSLAARAPDDITDEWQTVIGALTALHDALDRAGVRPQDFHAGKPPASLSPAQVAEISAAADRISSADVVDALNGIDQEAKDVCQLQLGL